MIRRHKYGAQKVSHKGYSFASKGEARHFDELKLRERAGEIKDIQVQDTVYLTDARIMYKPDFAFINCSTGEKEWSEYKGFVTTDFAIKKRLWKHYGPGKLTIHFAGGKTEIVFPKGEENK